MGALKAGEITVGAGYSRSPEAVKPVTHRWYPPPMDPMDPPVRDRAWTSSARLWLAAALAASAPLACAPTEGYVEIAWSFIDQGGSTLYPDGVLADSCDFTAAFAAESASDTLRPAKLRVELEICDPACDGDCEDPACMVVEPTQFACNTARGALTIPATGGDYRFTTRIVAELDGDPDCACVLSTDCALVPGPRDRAVRPGLVTDLQNYQFVLDVTDDPSILDLTPCCALPDSCA